MLSTSSQFRIRPKHLWKSFCFGLGMLYLLSFLVVGWLKFNGEVMPFCFYDNFFYATFYFALFLYSVMAMELADVPLTKSQARNWYSHKFIGCSVLFTEVEAFLQFIFSYRKLSFELDIDTVASPFIHALFALGVGRLVVIGLLATFGLRKLNRTILAKSYNGDIFGSVVTFFSDFTIIQLYCYTAYLYDFSLPLVLIISCVSYVYYKHIRV